MNPIPLYLTNLSPGTNLIRVGVPFPKGSVNDCKKLVLTENGNSVPKESICSSIVPTAKWSDGSVKWCLAKIATLDPEVTELELVLKSAAPPPSVAADPVLVDVSDDHDQIVISSDKTTFTFTKQSVFPSVNYAGNSVWQSDTSHPQLTLSDGRLCDLKIADLEIQDRDALSCKIVVSGSYPVSDKQSLSAKFIFEILPGNALSLACELHNPHRAIHPGGIWDLGDPGSILFTDFSLAIKKLATPTTSHLSPEPDGQWITVDSAEEKNTTVLFQASSGGKYWDNDVHRNAQSKVCNQFCGYKVTTGDKEVTTGKRSSPLLAIASENYAYSVQMENFWQNFPKSIDVTSDELLLRLFPHHHGDPYELQGGERKRHQLSFQFSSSFSQSDAINNNTLPQARVATAAYRQAEVFRYFDDEHNCNKYEKLLQPSKDDSKGFYAKREQLDEYSWRNFGDIYADHEAAHHTQDRPYVSHYNNQYDAVYGFLRQYAITGDPFWQPLHRDLANHIMDIDIYRTEEDRVEYNNGMFWHTDHYVEAHTATHRTYSVTQINSEGQPQFGGGPSSGHCYSTGLAYYYYMTGDEQAKETVIGLGDWIAYYQDGGGALLETAKRTLQLDTANFVKTCKGAKIFKYHYAMDREVGNYLRTLMDCYDLTADTKYITKIEYIIKNAAGPHDDIKSRGFDDVEHTWYYVVFLQELVRYLDLKREIDQQDNNFYHARATLLHYARWMAENEQPYLHNKDLEYPNATWIAQEPRKVNIFYAAYKYALTDRSIFLERARFFRDYLTEELSSCDTLHYSRIQILLLQNHGSASLIDIDSLPYPGIREVKVSDKGGCFHTPITHLKYITWTWFFCLAKFRISKELRWIKTRAS